MTQLQKMSCLAGDTRRTIEGRRDLPLDAMGEIARCNTLMVKAAGPCRPSAERQQAPGPDAPRWTARMMVEKLRLAVWAASLAGR
jgi:hypothetical protein